MPPQQHKPKTGTVKSAKGPTTNATSVNAVKQFFNLISLDIDVDRARQLQLRNKSITVLPPQLGTILGQVQKLDLSQNAISDLSPLGTLPHLTNLSLAGNTSLTSLESLSCTRLVVLSIANCGLASLRGLGVCRSTLRALIANDNRLQLQSPVAVEQASELAPYVPFTAASECAVANYNALASLEVCDTIVLSRNPGLCQLYTAPVFSESLSKPTASSKAKTADSMEEVDASDGNAADAENAHKDMIAAPADPEVRQLIASAHPLSVFEKLPQLKKLSLSECDLSSLPLRWFLPMTTELRLAKNDLPSFQPDGVICRSLKILDVTHNQLDVLATLRRCRYLKQLNLRGNPLVAHYQERDQTEGFSAAPAAGAPLHAVPITLLRSLPHLFTQLELIDGQPVPKAEELVARQKRAREEVAAEAETAERIEATSLPTVTTVPDSNGVTAAQVTRESKVERAARVAIEDDAKDVVTEAPESVVKTSRAPVVRRERVLAPTAAAGKVKVSGGEAVARLAAQRNQTNAW